MITTNERTIVSREEAERLLYETSVAPSSFADLDTAKQFNYAQHDTTKFDDLVMSQQKYQEAEAVQNYSSAAPVFEKYITNTSQISNEVKDTFRPQLFDEQLQRVDHNPVIENDLQKIAEVQIEEQVEQKREVKEYRQIESDSDQTVRLNTKGIIAVATFVAVLALVTVLVIINAINLGNSGARIDALQGSNSELRQELSGLDQQRRDFINSLTPEELANMGFGQITDIRTITNPSSTWTRPANPDHSTNWFDAISRFFSGLFR
ncbi:MAG: hypothetical protein FWE45_02975 [Firmicutes bacterium]|nr:hypothetical protein [Bacillota bacterium]